MREVEIKCAIDAAGAARIREVVSAAGYEWGPGIQQDDQAYAESDWDYGQPKIGRSFARLRTENGQRHLLTIKIPQSGELDCREIEHDVIDRAAADAQLRAEGFRPTTRIVKTRRTATWGSMRLCLDQVEHLGWFIEAEMLVADDQNGLELQTLMRNKLANFDVDLAPVTETYDSLLQRVTPRTATSTETADSDTVRP